MALEEGGAISEQVRAQVESDPALAKQLRDSARKELAVNALEGVKKQITAEQQEIINLEAERQLALDRLDVQFALEGKLDLSTQELANLLHPGDILDLFFKCDTARERLTLEWAKDAHDKTGWVYRRSTMRLYNRYGNILTIPDTLFAAPAVVDVDLENGTSVIRPDRLVFGRQLAVVQGTGEKRVGHTIHYRQYGHNSNMSPVILSGCDLQTKALHF
jgi:hypothetical protein